MIGTATLVAGLVCLGLVGCKKDDSNTGTPPLKDKIGETASAGEASAEMPAPAGKTAPAAGAMGGKVVETMDSGGYTYARLAVEGGGEVWVAGPQTKLEVGQIVGVTGGQLMRNFDSKSLGRTFPEIYFVSSLAAPGAAPASPHGGGQPASPHGKTAAAAVEVGAIEPAPGGVTIADLYAKKGELKGKQVTVRGKVVKFNAGIMGKNWLHLQDGSGKSGANDLTVTTDAAAKVGDVVTVKGTLGLDRDFGAGYKYAVIVEDATVAAK